MGKNTALRYNAARSASHLSVPQRRAEGQVRVDRGQKYGTIPVGEIEMFDIWMVLVPGGILALLVGAGLVIPRKIRRAGLVVLVVGAALLGTGVLRCWHVQNVCRSMSRAYRQVQNGMSKAEVEALLGEPHLIASADSAGKLQVPWKGRRDLDIPEAALAWEYRPLRRGLHLHRVYFDSDGRVIGKAAD